MKTTKRLFSWLIVLAMVIAMIPAIDLPTFAATDGEESAATAEPVRFPSDVESYEAECPVCKDTVQWLPYNGENYSEATDVVLRGTHHLYLTEDKTYESGKYFLAAYATICFNLNGYDITAAEGSKPTFMTSRTLNVIDTFGGSVVTGYANATGTGAALHANGGNATANYNIYGGTWTKLAADTASSIVKIGTNGGTINWYDGAVIDATGTEATASNTTGGAVGLNGCLKTTTTETTDETTGETTTETTTTYYKAVFNMYGGEIKGGTALSGGNVQVGTYSTTNFDCAVFNMYGGTVSGGTAVDKLKDDGTVGTSGAGGNFSVHYGATLNVYGGTIANGHVASDLAGGNWGGNIRAYTGNVNISGGLIYGGTGGKQLLGANVSVYSTADGRTAGRGFLTISGGTIVGDVATSLKNSGDLTISGNPRIVTSMEIDGVTYNAVSGGLCVNSGANLDVSNLTAEADIAVSGVTAGQFFTAESDNAAEVAACFKSVDGKLQGKAEGGKVYLTDAPTVGGPNLPAAAAAKIVAAAKVNNSDAAIDGYIAAKTCPMCGATNVTWTKGTTVVPSQVGTEGVKLHYWFEEEKAHTNNFVQMVPKTVTNADGTKTTTASKNNTICVALKSTAKITCTKYRVQLGGTGNTLNIMGTGTLQANMVDSGNSDLGLFQIDAGTLNLYGGNFLHKHAGGSTAYAVIRLNNATSVANIYNDANIGPAELDPTQPAMNVYMGHASAVLNIYGGTIRNGVAFLDNTSGNLHIVKGTVNMYGGTIIGGQHQVDAEGKAITYVKKEGAAAESINGTVASVRMSAGTFNMYGGTIQGGLSKNGGNGGGVYGSGSSVLNLMGGTIKDGESTSYGGNIAGWTTTVNIGGTVLIENGIAPSGGANIYIPNSKMIVNITGGTIRGGETKLGGNIYVNKNTNGGSLNISGGVIEGGVATAKDGAGGNIYVTETGVLTITGGVIKDGKATGTGAAGGNIYSNNDLTIGGNAVISGGEASSGGNISVPSGKTLTIEAGAQLLDGKATYGGNIFTNAGTIVSAGTIKGGQAKLHGGNISIGTGGSFTMNGGVLANGTLTEATTGAHWGGNIRSWNGRITINDGLVYGGTGATTGNIQANNIGALGDNVNYVTALTINGGTIVGDIHTSAVKTAVNEETGETEVTFPGTQVTLTGAPKIVKSLEIEGETVEATITGLNLVTGVKADISGLTAEAQIVIASPISGAALTEAFDGAAALADVFTPYNEERYYIELGEDNVFYHNSYAVAVMSDEENATWYRTAEEAVAAYYANGSFEKAEYLRVGVAEVTLTLAGDAYVNLAGYDTTVAGSGTVYGFDSANDDYNGYGLLTVAEGAEVQIAAETKLLNNRYIAVPEDGQYGFHRLAMWISAVTLRTSNPGMYYKAAYQCDTVLRDAVSAYGIALSLNAVPGLDFAEASGVKYTSYDGSDFAAAYSGTAVNTNSGAIVGILKTRNSQEQNTANLNRHIYANAYITFTFGDETHTVVSDSKNIGKTVEDEEFKGTAYSLAEILEAVNENWADYSEEDQATIAGFIQSWAPYVTEATVAELQTKLNNIFG